MTGRLKGCDIMGCHGIAVGRVVSKGWKNKGKPRVPDASAYRCQLHWDAQARGEPLGGMTEPPFSTEAGRDD